MTPSEDSFNRQRGLTNADREFLVSDRSEMDENLRRQKWHRIRERVRSVVQDFPLLLEHLPPDRLGQIFYPEDRDLQAELSDGMIAAMALFFLQRAQWAQHADPPEGFPDLEGFSDPVFEWNHLVREAVAEALWVHNLTLQEYKGFSIETNTEAMEELRQRFLAGDRLSLEEFETLQREGMNTDLRNMAYVKIADMLEEPSHDPNSRETEDASDTDGSAPDSTGG